VLVVGREDKVEVETGCICRTGWVRLVRSECPPFLLPCQARVRGFENRKKALPSLLAARRIALVRQVRQESVEV